MNIVLFADHVDVHDSKVYCLTMLNSMQCIMAKTGSLMGDVTFVQINNKLQSTYYSN